MGLVCSSSDSVRTSNYTELKNISNNNLRTPRKSTGIAEAIHGATKPDSTPHHKRLKATMSDEKDKVKQKSQNDSRGKQGDDVSKEDVKNFTSQADPKKTHQPKTKPKKTTLNGSLTSLLRWEGSSLDEKLEMMNWLEERMEFLKRKIGTDDTDKLFAAQAPVDDNREEGIETRQNEKSSEIHKQIVAYKSEKQQLLNLVSEIAGNRLKNNNPTIADLSDKNRASKLAEGFSELYDNEWTDVVEVIRTPPKGKKLTTKEEEILEEKCITFLVEFAKIAYNNCRKKAKDDLDSMKKIVVKTTEPSLDVTKRCKDFMKSRMSASEESLQQVTKQIGEKVKDEIGKGEIPHFKEFNERLKKSVHYDRYSDNCVKLCWFMCLQDPPVVMMADITPESTKDHFRAYTRSGPYLGFIVWPALFLHKDGPLLYKGVAQYADKETIAVKKTDL